MSREEAPGIDRQEVLGHVEGMPVPIPPEALDPSRPAPVSFSPPFGTPVPRPLRAPDPEPPPPRVLLRHRAEFAAGVMLAVGAGWTAIAAGSKDPLHSLFAALFFAPGLYLFGRRLLARGA